MATNQLPDMSSHNQFEGMPLGGMVTCVVLACAGALARYLHRCGVVSFQRLLLDIPAVALMGFITFLLAWAFRMEQWQAYIAASVSGWIGVRLMDWMAKVGEARIKAQIGKQ